ncbi:MAG TPA: DegT/DnrJ/EryC1/StrS family aminotransferase [Kofleriaceae bacterium]|jgi:dTDP-4-amino-4,6-dideoxygalactose transaminase|nr:DegT/DnrJ/EryC1/StrS family aminotransferase [Kofleriaceae bacterium]
MQTNPSSSVQLPISDKCLQRTPGDATAVSAALQGAISGGSDVITEYETELARVFGARHAIAVSSGGAALVAALYGAGVRPGDEVVLPPTCPLCTVYPIMSLGATPVFCDTSANDFGLDLEDLARVTTPRTRAVIDVPMWGYPTPVDRLRDATRALGVPLVLDLAHSHGAKLGGRDLSSYGDLSCYSTHERKIISTGEGGFILSDNDKLVSVVRSYIKFGNLNGRDFGLNFKLSGVQAALGKARLSHLEDLLARRRNTAQRIAAGIRRSGVRAFDILPGGAPSYYFMLLRLSLDDNRKFIDYLDDKGIPSDIKRYGCKTLYQFPALQQFMRRCDHAEALLSSVTTLPVHPGITEAQADYMVAAINGF